jgi:hypothetical protein
MSRISHNPKNNDGKTTKTTAKACQQKGSTGEKRGLPFTILRSIHHILIVNQIADKAKTNHS